MSLNPKHHHKNNLPVSPLVSTLAAVSIIAPVRVIRDGRAPFRRSPVRTIIPSRVLASRGGRTGTARGAGGETRGCT